MARDGGDSRRVRHELVQEESGKDAEKQRTEHEIRKASVHSYHCWHRGDAGRDRNKEL
jgi:hypothetical protein